MTVRGAFLINGLAVACLVVAIVKQGAADPGHAYLVIFGSGDGRRLFDAFGRPAIVPWLIAAAVLVTVSTVLLLLRHARVGVVGTVAGLVCMAVAIAQHQRSGGAHYISRPVGGTDFTGFFELRNPAIAGWVVVAAVLTVAATAVLVRGTAPRRSPTAT